MRANLIYNFDLHNFFDRTFKSCFIFDCDYLFFNDFASFRNGSVSE